MVAANVVAPRTTAVFTAFTAYGSLWGPYLSMLPDVQRATGADAGQLGIALLAGALAAMPAMYAVGRLLDRYGRPVVTATFVLFALVSAGPSLAGSIPMLMLTVSLFGFASGACNVAVVALAATVEAGVVGPRVMNRSHALFSVGLLVCSLGTGLARSADVPGQIVAAAVAVAVAAGAVGARRLVPEQMQRQARTSGRAPRLTRPILLLCLLGAMAMLVESGVQQWSAVFLADVTHAPVGLSAAAPGVFAAGMAAGRLGGHWLTGRVADRWLLCLSGAGVAGSVLVLSSASDPWFGLIGTALVGVAISVSTPTVYGLVGRQAEPADRGAVIGSAASLASVGLLVGPAVVGQVAQQIGLPLAIAALSVVAAAICLLALSVRDRTGATPVTAPHPYR